MANDLQRWMRDNGWTILRNARGDHKVYEFPGTGRRLAVPCGRLLTTRELKNITAQARRLMRAQPRT